MSRPSPNEMSMHELIDEADCTCRDGDARHREVIAEMYKRAYASDAAQDELAEGRTERDALRQKISDLGVERRRLEAEIADLRKPEQPKPERLSHCPHCGGTVEWGAKPDPKPERWEPCFRCGGNGWVAVDADLDPDCRTGTCDCTSKPKPTDAEIDRNTLADLRLRVEALEARKP